MDKSQRRLSRKATFYRDSKFGLVAVPAFAVSAASYIVIETDNSGPLGRAADRPGSGRNPEPHSHADHDPRHANTVARMVGHRHRPLPPATHAKKQEDWKWIFRTGHRQESRR